MSNTKFTSERPSTEIVFSAIRPRYYFPDYIDPRQYRYVSRYKNYRRIKDNEENSIFLESINQDTISESDSDLYITVDNTNSNRLDAISYKYYGYSTYWWVIALANNIIDPFKIPYGTVLRIPPLSSLYENGGVLSI